MPLIIPAAAWVPATPAIISTPDNRSGPLLMQVLQQWGVETNPRYQRNAQGYTMCNIFLWDWSVAMTAEIPHWINPEDGSPVAMGKGKELSANGVCDWLAMWGSKFNWNATSLAGAMEFALAGKPAMACWKNPKGGPGHVAPLTSTGPGPHITQAGGRNFSDLSLASGFGQYPVNLYRHV